jgi:hypothetical protein
VGVEANHIQERAKHLVRQNIRHLVFHQNQVDWAPINSDLNIEANEAWGKAEALVWGMAPSFQASEAPSLTTSVSLEMVAGALWFQALAMERAFEA